MSLETTSSLGLNGDGDIGLPCWILSLPDELLCLILAAVADLEPPVGTQLFIYKTLKRGTRDKVLGWLRLSEVCTRFHVLLLSMAALWAGVVFELPVKPGKLALACSKSAPLPVIIRSSYKPFSQHTGQGRDVPDLIREHLIAVAIHHVARMCSLSTENLSFVICKQLLSAPLLYLEELRMFYDTYCPADPSQDIGSICVNAPIVRRADFTFNGTTFYYMFSRAFTFRLPALRSLKIYMSDWSGQDMHEPSWITDILQTSRLLSHLSLALPSSFPIDWSTLFDGRNITLTHLRSLELRGNATANLLELYKHIGSPRPARCVVTCGQLSQEDTNEIGHILNFANIVSPLFQRLSHSGLEVEIEKVGGSRVLTLRMFPSRENPRQCVDSDISTMSLMSPVSMGLTLPADDPVYSCVVAIIAKALQDNQVSQLVISSASLKVWPTAIEAIVSACPAVTELFVNRTSDGLWEPFSDFPFPAMANLLPALDSVFFKPQIDYGVSDEEASANISSCWEECITWLASRAGAGLRVRRLHIIGQDGGDGEMYARAAEFVDEFVDERGV